MKTIPRGYRAGINRAYLIVKKINLGVHLRSFIMEELEIQRLYDEKIKEKFKFDFNLNNEQLSAISGCLQMSDVFTLLPTGYGKSMCYTLVPLLMDLINPATKHIAIVVSPLIALIEDQCIEMRQHGISCASLAGSLTAAEINDIQCGSVSVLLTSPEVAMLPQWRSLLLTKTYQERVCLLACDEAHCVSEWGDDFRPEFREISSLRSLLACPVMALTATATDKVRDDVFRYLLLDSDSTKTVAMIPDRPNIFLDIVPCSQDFEQELHWLLEHLITAKERSKKTIVFCRTYNMTYAVWAWLVSSLGDACYIGERKARKRMVEMFHASTDRTTKEFILTDFKKPDSVVRYVIATIAFGMGVQIKDIDVIVHWGASKTVLSYWQEVGRCARDKRKGYACMYAYKRSLMKTVTEDSTRSLVRNSSGSCVRNEVLSVLLTKGMDESEIPKSSPCAENCKECSCKMCMCCSYCRGQCSCSGKVSTFRELFYRI